MKSGLKEQEQVDQLGGATITTMSAATGLTFRNNFLDSFLEKNMVFSPNYRLFKNK